MELTKIADNYLPESMSFSDGFMGPKGDVGFFMCADQEKAKQIIESFIKEGREISEVSMGLDGDWNINSQTIYENGEYFGYEAWGSSTWAKPIILIYFSDGTQEAFECWKKEEKLKS